MRLKFKVGVDSGAIMVADSEYFDVMPANPGFDDFTDIEPGRYDVRWRIPGTFNGDIEGRSVLDVESGKLFVGDPGYVVDSQDDWLQYLKSVDYFDGLDTGLAFVINSMGGDGSYEVELEFSPRRNGGRSDNT